MTDSQMLRQVGLSPQDLEKTARLFASGVGFQEYDLAKRGGGVRTIYAPVSECGTVLKMLRIAFESAAIYFPPDCVHGYISGRGIRSNAIVNLDQDVVLNLDLADFFPSIGINRIESALITLGLDAPFAQLVARSTTVGGVLPAGFSTSPLLSNIVFRETDIRLVAFAKSAGLQYTRYADDLTFSGAVNDRLLVEVSALLESQDWVLNKRKIRFMRRGGPQYVTGLYVGCDDYPRVPRRLKRRLRQRLYYMAKYGIEDVQGRHRNESMSPSSAFGWASYVRQMEPDVAVRLLEAAGAIDFSSHHPRWGNPEDWTEILDAIGM